MGVQLNQIGLAGFDSNEIVPDSFDQLPAGAYLAVITDSVQKSTNDQKGSYIELAFEVVDGPSAGRKFWDRLNLDNPNVMTREIAQKTLSSIARAVGIFGPLSSTDDLHDRPLNVTVTYKEKNGYQNARYRYTARSGAAQISPAGAIAASSGVGNGKKPWER